ncbi:uncharacterized protein LOC143695300 [Agelaius phoeniceus]|uniref:uncharacterized protein LOC143695300 n=1 Tax=Agelaius phoeniceus TaxID=39638 RepID=UPI0040551FF6
MRWLICRSAGMCGELWERAASPVPPLLQHGLGDTEPLQQRARSRDVLGDTEPLQQRARSRDVLGDTEPLQQRARSRDVLGAGCEPGATAPAWAGGHGASSARLAAGTEQPRLGWQRSLSAKGRHGGFPAALQEWDAHKSGVKRHLRPEAAAACLEMRPDLPSRFPASGGSALLKSRRWEALVDFLNPS